MSTWPVAELARIAATDDLHVSPFREDATLVLGYGEESVSVAMEEVDSRDWAERVYRPDIVEHADRPYRKPGYRM